MGRIVIITFFIMVFLISCGKKDATVKTDNALDPPSLLKKGTQQYNEDNLEAALTNFETIYTRYPTSREYISAVIGMARCYNDMGDFERGFQLLYNLIRENMVPTRVPEIYNEMARYYEVHAIYSTEAGISNKAEDFQKAIDLYTKSVKYPNSDDVVAKSYAQFKVGDLNQQLEKYEDAALAYQSTIYKFPNTEWAQIAQTRIADLKQAGQQVLSPIDQPKQSQTTEETETPETAPPPELQQPVVPDTSQVME
jgi:tetratricopeptide (TPR) repeat protein